MTKCSHRESDVILARQSTACIANLQMIPYNGNGFIAIHLRVQPHYLFSITSMILYIQTVKVTRNESMMKHNILVTPGTSPFALIAPRITNSHKWYFALHLRCLNVHLIVQIHNSEKCISSEKCVLRTLEL